MVCASVGVAWCGMNQRYALVAVDKLTGRIYVSPETLSGEYSKEDVEEIMKFMPSALKESRDFYVMPHDQAVGLWAAEKDESAGENKRTTH